MSSQLIINIPTAFTKFNTLLPLCPNDTNQIERDLISKLDRDLFSNKQKTNTNTIATTTSHSLNSYPHCIKANIYNPIVNPSYTQTYLPSPPRSPKSFAMASPTMRSTMVSQLPKPVEIRTPEIMTVTSKMPLFGRNTTNYIYKNVVSAENGPVVLKLRNLNYPTTVLNSSPNQRVGSVITPSSTPSPAQSKTPFAITVSSAKQRRFRCKTCSMAFTTSGHLSRHNRIHTGERNYTCPHEGCGQKFSRHDNCLQHYRTHLKKQGRRRRRRRN